MYFVYILKNKIGKHYIGSTENLQNRLKHHNGGANKSTRLYRPWKIVYSEEHPDKKSAWSRERQIKSYKGGEAFKKLLKIGDVA